MTGTLNTISRYVVLVFLLLLISTRSFAHDIILDLDSMSKGDAAWLYLKLGFQHILPMGLDHILFVLSLFLLSPKLKPILWQSLAFTVAHSVTLGLCMYGVIKPPGNIVEPLISLSIMFVALENIFSPKLKATRIGLVFLFGLVHGMGFAGALQGLGLPQQAYFGSLVMFNAGVELGQLTVILIAYFAVGKWLGGQPIYRKAVVIPLSVVITIIAATWTVQRFAM